MWYTSLALDRHFLICRTVPLAWCLASNSTRSMYRSPSILPGSTYRKRNSVHDDQFAKPSVTFLHLHLVQVRALLQSCTVLYTSLEDFERSKNPHEAVKNLLIFLY